MSISVLGFQSKRWPRLESDSMSTEERSYKVLYVHTKSRDTTSSVRTLQREIENEHEVEGWLLWMISPDLISKQVNILLGTPTPAKYLLARYASISRLARRLARKTKRDCYFLPLLANEL